jgi:hypothetical protein
MISTVALIANINSACLFECLARCMPVWVADTEANEFLKNLLLDQRESLSITWFPLRHGETLDAAGMRICFSLDDHYNDDAQSIGYKGLLTFGIPYAPALQMKLEPLGFKKIEPTEFGFVATK